MILKVTLRPLLVVDGAGGGIQAAVGDQAARAADPDIHADAHRIATGIARRGRSRQGFDVSTGSRWRSYGVRSEQASEIHEPIFLRL